ncbi:MAG: MBOAT family protein [Oscillospiraceae bacterium]|nr:MBOAT family protein [Oscillospiraceae bacterium]
MLFSSIPFLYYFLPIVLIVYFAVPKVLKNAVLLLASLVFYAWGEPKYVVLMIASILMFYGCGLAIGKAETKKMKKLWLTVSVVVSLTLLGIFKYADFFVDSFNAATGLSVPLLRLALPIGISFYTFQCLSYTIDVYRGNVPVQKNPISFGAYVALFPQLIAGPIVRYIDVARELNNRTHSWENFVLGLRRFMAGLAKKILLANALGELTNIFRDSGEKSVVFYWLYAIAFALHIYFDFSGYSDMAIGLGKIFGFNFIENFNYPYLSKSVAEFWRRWHMSLGSWFRDYVYIPLGGNRVSKGRWVFNTFVVWALTGLWHGAAWNFVLWGLLYAVFLMIEKWVPALQKLPTILRRGYVLLVVLLGFVLFNATDLSQAVADIKGLFGFGNVPFITGETLYYLKSYGVLFILGFVGATPLVKRLHTRLSEGKWGNALAVLEPVLMAGALLICTAYLVDGSFNPFLYFRF